MKHRPSLQPTSREQPFPGHSMPSLPPDQISASATLPDLRSILEAPTAQQWCKARMNENKSAGCTLRGPLLPRRHGRRQRRICYTTPGSVPPEQPLPAPYSGAAGGRMGHNGGRGLVLVGRCTAALAQAEQVAHGPFLSWYEQNQLPATSQGAGGSRGGPKEAGASGGSVPPPRNAQVTEGPHRTEGRLRSHWQAAGG